MILKKKNNWKFTKTGKYVVSKVFQVGFMANKKQKKPVHLSG